MADMYDTLTNQVISCHIDINLKKYLDNIIKPLIQKKDKDYVMLIDGYEGSGKSTFAQQIAKYVDSSFCLDRMCMTADEFKQAIIKASKAQAIVYDEAVTGLTASDSITRIGRLLKSMMMQMRQKNLFIIVIIPIIFDLNRYAVLSRARAFFHIYEASGRMGYWSGFNAKDLRKLYLRGKKTHSYKVRTNFRGRFYGKWLIDEDAYRKKKEEALFSIDDEEIGTHKWEKQRDGCFVILHKDYKVPVKEISDKLKDLTGLVIRTRTIYDGITRCNGTKRQTT